SLLPTTPYFPNKCWVSQALDPTYSLLPQLEALNLARGGAGQIRPHVDPARIFPRSRALLHVQPQRFEQLFVGAIAVLEDNEGFRPDQAVAVRLADDGGFEHGFMRDERGLDLERRHPHAIDLEHIIGAPAVMMVACMVADIFIPGIGPFAHERSPVLYALIPVAFRRRRAAHNELSDLACRQLVTVLIDDLDVIARHRLAGRSIADIAGTVAQKRLQHLGRAETVENVHAHDRAPALAKVGGQRLARRDAQLQAVRSGARD